MGVFRWKLFRFGWAYSNNGEFFIDMGTSHFYSYKRVFWKLYFRTHTTPHHGRFWNACTSPGPS